jgi:hypothetical protein
MADQCERSQCIEGKRLCQIQRIEARVFDFVRALDQIREHVTAAPEGRPQLHADPPPPHRRIVRDSADARRTPLL